MRIVRVLWLMISVLLVGTLLAPVACAEPPMRLPDYVTDEAGALNAQQHSQVSGAVQQLYDKRGTRLWVVYVDTFSESSPRDWAESTWRKSFLGNHDAILAVAIKDRAYALLVPEAATGDVDVDRLRQEVVEAKLHDGDWAGAAVAAADGLRGASSAPFNWVGLVIALAVIGVAFAGLIWWARRRRRQRRQADLNAAQQADATDPAVLAKMSPETLEDLSKSILVEVDNAVRTSDNELALAVGEFGERDTAPFIAAVQNAKAAIAQAFSVRQTLDDAVPETPQQRRDLLTQVVVSAARADRELENQRTAFHQMRDLVINAPTRLDALTQQMVALTARIEPAQQTLTGLHGQFTETALASVAGNVDGARERLAFADQNITAARGLVSKPSDSQAALVNAIRAAESAVGQAQRLLDSVDSAASDIAHAISALPAAITDIQNGIAAAEATPPGAHYAELMAARTAAVQAVSNAQASGAADPLSAFTQLTAADSQLDKLLATISEETAALNRLRQSFGQALLAAQSRVRGVSDFIDTRRGSVGSEARTRLAEAQRRLEAAQAAQATDLPAAIEQANAADALAAQAQRLADDDVRAARQAYAGTGTSTAGDIGGIIIGGILSGMIRGGGSGGGSHGGGWSSTSFGGSGGGFSGGGGRF
ncbi:membrane protein [Mycolicibacterium sp. TY66]|uniref:TPM domain-containing protein n=1 Tax=unclassified Mycolicibacterium TaxID=2636767 RepID=UPI001BB33D7F|nr:MULTISPECIES: TPM domain-containing protein [unclassified Mycolicibacterium]BCI82720.1 membrane protein [Mycolicibacterium sp. TY66]BCJ79633.1 membrane protein [Mycolicibacterium sp. TY81]